MKGNIKATFRKIIDHDYFLDEKTRIILVVEKIKKSEQYPDGLRFAASYLYISDNAWKQIVRIDNFPHQGKQGTHIHQCNKDDVKFEDIPLEKAEETVIVRGNKLVNQLGLKVKS